MIILNTMKNLTNQNNDQTEHNEEPDHLKERLLLSVLPRHVAMEMKADIAGSVKKHNKIMKKKIKKNMEMKADIAGSVALPFKSSRL